MNNPVKSVIALINVKLPAHRAGLPGKERTRHDCAPPVMFESPLKTIERIESRITMIFLQF